MPYLLADDADGKVLAELPTWDAALWAIEAIEREDPDRAAGLCVVSFSDHDGTLVGVERSTTLRSLT
jgi:hypothetical protein